VASSWSLCSRSLLAVFSFFKSLSFSLPSLTSLSFSSSFHMSSFTKFFVLLSLALSVATLATPSGHDVHRHRSIAAQVAAPVARRPFAAQGSVRVRKRKANGKRCVRKAFSDRKAVAVPATTHIGGITSSSPTVAAHTMEGVNHHPTQTPPAQSQDNGSGGPSFMHGTQTGQGLYDLELSGVSADQIFPDVRHIFCPRHGGLWHHQRRFRSYRGSLSLTVRLISVRSKHDIRSFALTSISSGYDGSNPNTNPLCNKKIVASCKPRTPSQCLIIELLSDQGKSTTVTVTDRCQACATTDLDFSPAAFDDLANPALGRIDITWSWS
jgi:heme exporter protein D